MYLNNDINSDYYKKRSEESQEEIIRKIENIL